MPSSTTAFRRRARAVFLLLAATGRGGAAARTAATPGYGRALDGPDAGGALEGADARRGHRPCGSAQRTDRDRPVRRGQGRGRRAAGPQRAIAAGGRRGVLRPHDQVGVLGDLLGRLRRRRVRRCRPLGTAVRPAQRVPAEPGVLAGAVRRRAHCRPAATGRRRAKRCRQLAAVGSGPAGAGRDAGVLRRGADRPAGGHRRGVAATGGSHRRPGGTVLQGRPQPRVRVAPRPGHAGQPAPERDSRACEPDARVSSSEAVARDPVGAACHGRRRARRSDARPPGAVRRSTGPGEGRARRPDGRGAGAGPAGGLRRPRPRGDTAHHQSPATALRLAQFGVRRSGLRGSPGVRRLAHQLDRGRVDADSALHRRPVEGRGSQRRRGPRRGARAPEARGGDRRGRDGGGAGRARRGGAPRGRRAPARWSRPRGRTKSRICATARASRRSSNCSTPGWCSNWPRSIARRPHATCRSRARGFRCCPICRWAGRRSTRPIPAARRKQDLAEASDSHGTTGTTGCLWIPGRHRPGTARGRIAGGGLRRHWRPAAATGAGSATGVSIGPESVVTVARDEIRTGPLLSGELRAVREAMVRAKMPGSVLEVTVEEGQSVSAARSSPASRRARSRTRCSRRSPPSRSAEQALAVAEREAERTATWSRAEPSRNATSSSRGPRWRDRRRSSPTRARGSPRSGSSSRTPSSRRRSAAW